VTKPSETYFLPVGKQSGAQYGNAAAAEARRITVAAKTEAVVRFMTCRIGDVLGMVREM
jgi:hypothetical protein